MKTTNKGAEKMEKGKMENFRVGDIVGTVHWEQIGQKEPDCVWRVIGVTAKRVTITYAGEAKSPRFAGRKYIFSYDGKGYCRQAQYLVR
jgi:hypothetical protein